MRIKPIIILLLLPLLPACTGLTVGAGAATVGIFETRPDDPPPADLADQVPSHESWCYKTAGYVECYSHPQDVPPGRLIMVDPANHYPLTSHEYHEAVAVGQ